MLVNPARLLRQARLEGRALAAFNIHNMETLQAAAQAAKASRCPLLLQATPATVEFAGADYLVAMARIAAGDGSAVALHLDHASDLKVIGRCLKAGFTSVMYDGSHLPLANNISTTIKVLELAGEYGAAVEAELGQIGGREEGNPGLPQYTEPEQAQAFVNETGVDSLAVAIGTVHGLYRGEPCLDFKRLAEIARRVACPLVLHGGSGLPAAAIQQAIGLGVAKVNIATELKISFTQALMEAMDDLAARSPESFDPRKYMGAARQRAYAVARDKTDMCWNIREGLTDGNPQ